MTQARLAAIAFISTLLLVVFASELRAGGLQIKAPEAATLSRTAAQKGMVPIIVELRSDVISPAHQGRKRDIDLKRASSRAVNSFLTRFFGHKSRRGRVMKARAVKTMTYVPMVAFRATSRDLKRLAADPKVLRVYEDKPLKLQLNQSVPLIGVDALTQNSETGSNSVVAILDTGVQTTHPFFANRVVAEACFSSTTSYPSQSLCPNGASEQTGTGSGVACSVAAYGAACNHGTHVAGIAAGGGQNTTPTQGVAKGASIFALQVFAYFPGQNSVLSWSSDQLKALEHVYARRNDFPGKRIAAVNMSLGGGSYSGVCSSPLTAIVGTLRNAGILTVIAAGNDGYTNAMSSPACTAGAVSVASSTKSDTRSSFSNISAITTFFAPGSSILSSVTGNGTQTMSGTSMAAPHVAGAVALLASAAPNATADQILSALVTAGKAIASPQHTKPRIQVDAALELLGGSLESNLQISSTDPVVIERIGDSLSATSFQLILSAKNGSADWVLAGIPSWLQASPSKGLVTTAGTTINFTIKAPKNQTTDLSAVLSFADTKSMNEPLTVPVLIDWIPQTLSLSPNSSITIANTNAIKASPSAFTVMLSSNIGTAQWKLGGLPAWLKASLRQGTAVPQGTPITFTVIPKRAKETATATLTFTMTSGSKASVSLPVTINYITQKLKVSTVTATAVSQANAQPSPQILQIEIATSTGQSAWRVTKVPYWLVPSATSGTVDTNGATLSFTVVPQPTIKRPLTAKLNFFLDGVQKVESVVPITLQPKLKSLNLKMIDYKKEWVNEPIQPKRGGH